MALPTTSSPGWKTLLALGKCGVGRLPRGDRLGVTPCNSAIDVTATVPAVESTILGQELTLRTTGSGALDVRSSADQHLNSALATAALIDQVNIS